MDIDGNDYYVWKAVEDYRPKIVVIEYNPTIPECVDFVQPPDPSTMQGAGLLTLANLGKEKGYELICVTTGNAIFIDRQYFPLFEKDNFLRQDRRNLTYLFCGSRSMPATASAMALNYLGKHMVEEIELEYLPRLLREPSYNYGPWKKFLYSLYILHRKV